LAAAATVAGLDGMTPHRLRVLLRRHHPEAALAVVRGDLQDDVFSSLVHGSVRAPANWFASWRATLSRSDPSRLLERCHRGGIGVLLLDDPRYPPCLRDDPEAPAVLFYRGDLGVLDARRVAVVGTRSATTTGRGVATEIGRALAEHRVCVVSGLARGIDGYAHRGALAAEGGAAPAGVVASGLDVVYPREHTDLWDRVGRAGLLLSERPPGSPPRACAFPQRNRILAAVAEAVVVIESRAKGGSLLTVAEAAKRDITVMAVPGSVASRASEGTNELIRSGVVVPVLDPTDVLVALGLDTRRARRRRFDPRPPLDGANQALLDLIGADAVTLEQLALRCGRDLVDVAMALGRLEAERWVVRSGGWFEALPPPEAGS
jgi:DNA processing protein